MHIPQPMHFSTTMCAPLRSIEMALTGQRPRHSSQDVQPRSMVYFFFMAVILQLAWFNFIAWRRRPRRRVTDALHVGLLYVGKCFPQGLEVNKNLMYIAEYLTF